MSKLTEKTLVPELRFLDFRTEDMWQENFLGNLGKFNGGGTPSKSIETYWQGSIPWVSSSDILDESVHQINISRFITEEAIKETATKLIPENSILLVSRVGVGKLAVSKEKICTSQDFTNFTPSKDNLFFLAYYLKSLSKTLLEYSQGMAIKGFTKDDVVKLQLFLPQIEEQQKIADCLSSIDDLITAHSQKHEALKAHKKGLMQQLFPATGETVPKRRFPEFRDAGAWEERPLKKVFSIFQGFAFSSKDSVKAGVRWLKIADVSIQHMNHKTLSYLPVEHKDKHEKFSVKQGDYVIALTRPILSKQLKMARVDKVYDGALLNQRVGKLVTTQNISFVYFLLQTSKVISDIEISISGSEPPNLSAQQIEDIITNIPSKKEQQKIADCLSSLDNLITTQAQKIESLKAHKKGLMQQLFPTVDEAGA